MNLKIRDYGRRKSPRPRERERVAAGRVRVPGENLNFSGNDAFTLMEVMIAIGVFSIGVFAILDVVASVMHGARLLNKPMVDGGCVAGEIALTNSLVEEQLVSGDLGDFLGDQYKNYPYEYAITEVESNKLFRADILVHSDAPGKPVISKMSVLLFRPLSPPGSLDGGMGPR